MKFCDARARAGEKGASARKRWSIRGGRAEPDFTLRCLSARSQSYSHPQSDMGISRSSRYKRAATVSPRPLLERETATNRGVVTTASHELVSRHRLAPLTRNEHAYRNQAH